MKTILQKLFFVTSMLLCVTNATAYDFEADGIYYNILSETEKTVEVTYRIYLYDYDNYSYRYTGSVIIPATVNYNNVTYSVTSIGDKAFRNCYGLTSITIPGSVTSIGNDAFRGCTGLTSVTIPNSVTNIGSSAFEDCYWLTSVTILNSLTSIGSYAFYDCTRLINITIPNSVTSIGYGAFDNTAWYSNQADGVVYLGKVLYKYKGTMSGSTLIVIKDSTLRIASGAFSDCTGLTSITIPNSVTSIGNYAFSGCTGLTSIEIPSSVTTIGESAFSGCTGLTSIEIPSSVTTIGESALQNCTGLTNVTIPNSVTSIGNSVFSGCTGLKTVVNFSNLTFTKGSSDYGYIACNVINAPNGEIVGDFGFYTKDGRNYLGGYIGNDIELVLPSDYKGEEYGIGHYSFTNNTELNRITIPNGVTSIEENAFDGCTGLTRVVIPKNVTSIGNNAFNGCTGLARIVILEGVTSIGNSAFSGCTGLTSIEIPSSVTTIGESALQNCTGLTNVTIPNSVTSIGDGTFENCDGLTSVTIGNSVTSIGESAFENCRNLTNVTIGNSVTSIGWKAFKNCTNLTSITIPNSVTSIKWEAFRYCNGLTSVTIGNGVTSIGESAFYGCSRLTSITIGNSVTSIGESAFEGCDRLYEVHISDLAAWCSIDFNSSPLYYADNLYLNGELVTELVIPDSVNEIKQDAFYDCDCLTSITIGNGVTSIGESAFENCDGLTSVTMPNSVTSIGNYAFSYCTSLTSITIPNSVTSIGSKAFGSCKELKIITIPNSVTSIGDYAFCNCDELTSVTIGNSVTSIGDGAFEGCYRLISITIGNSVTSIGARAFEGCDKLNEVHINDLAAWCNIDFNSNPLYYAHKLYLNGELVTELVIPDDVSEIKKCVFSGCDGLTSITIGNGVKSIGDYAFENCTNIVSITSLIPADKLFELGLSVFSGINKNSCTLYVPNEAIEAYLITKGWEDFINIIEVYNVNFIVENEIYTTYYIPEGNKILYPKVPEKEGYTFSGWSEAPKTMPAEDITITGSFTVNSYIVTYIVDGEVYATDSIAYGATIEPLEEATKEGHTFSGWSEIPAIMPAEDITITGSFTANSYIVTFMIDGEAYDTATVEYGTEIELPTPPEKEGYIFSGWVGVPETMPAEDITITGSFTINSYILTYIVDGKVYASDSIAYGATIEPLEEPTKEGHTFSGWSEIPAIMPAEDITITGSFTANSYIVTFMIDGEAYDTATVEYGTEIELPTPPEKEGYIFSGWVGVPETMPAEDITITGSFTINSYILTYIVDGKVYASDSIAYGATIEPLEEPTKEGHTFSGWSEIPAIMPAEDITITGSFTANSYIVTFMIDGEVYDTATVEYGTEIELPTPPEKEGYIFSGWVGVPETMPAEDIVIEGSYEVDTTGINAIELDLERNEVYNLNGLQITETENLSRGFYIINGKKVYVK